MADKNKKYLESKGQLTEENIRLRIENEVLKKQLFSIRDTINIMLGEDEKTQEIVKKVIESINAYYDNFKSVGNQKEVDMISGGVRKKKPKIRKCLNCQQQLPEEYEKSFCQKCLTRDYGKKDKVAAASNEKPKPSEKVVMGQGGYVEETKTTDQINTEALEKIKEAKEKNKQKKYEPTAELDPKAENYKCFHCEEVSDDMGAFKKHDGEIYCIDCLDKMMNGS